MAHPHPVTDFHIHIQPWEQLRPEARKVMERPDMERVAGYIADPNAFLDALDQWGVQRAALINYVAPDTLGFDDSVNEWIVRYCDADPKRLLPVGSVHPRLAGSAGAAYRAVEGLADSGIRMLKIHPAHQLVWPDAYRADSRGARGHPPDDKPYGDALSGLYEALVDRRLPLMVHTGTSSFPGALNPPADPMNLDAVATDFPDLRLVLAHVGRPLWGDAAVFLARRHPNVYLDLSSIPPHRLARYVPNLSRIWKKCIWGTDWPGPGLPKDAPRENVTRFLSSEHGLSDEAIAAVLDGNSRILLP